jgi:hypothetical protein
MDTDKTTTVEIDLSEVNQDWSVDGHGDPFVTSTMISSGLWTDTLNISNGVLAPGYGAVPPVTIQTWPNTTPTYTFSDISATPPPSGKITLKGDDADIEINGESVVGMLREIRDRLCILQVSKEMEQEWDELRALREQYEAKLADCVAKSKAWQLLKQSG